MIRLISDLERNDAADQIYEPHRDGFTDSILIGSIRFDVFVMFFAFLSSFSLER